MSKTEKTPILPEPTLPAPTPTVIYEMDREFQKKQYQAELYTQLIINTISPNQAMERAKEAADVLFRFELPFPRIKVG